MVRLHSWADFGTEDRCSVQSGRRLSQQGDTAVRIFPWASFEK